MSSCSARRPAPVARMLSVTPSRVLVTGLCAIKRRKSSVWSSARTSISRRGDSHAPALEDEIARDSPRLRPRPGITQIDVCHFRDDLENARIGPLEGELREFALQPQADIIRPPSLDRGLEVLGDPPGQPRNVAVHGAAVHAAEAPGEVDDARAALLAGEAARERPGDIRVRERQVVEAEPELAR